MQWLQRILMATDFSRQAQRAEESAVLLASAASAQLEFVHVVEVFPGLHHYRPLQSAPVQEIRDEVDKHLLTVMQRAQAQGVTAAGKQRQGIPSEEIIEEAQSGAADLIVVGTQGRTGLEHVLMGSTAERVVKGAPCPVLTVPSSNKPIETDKLFRRIVVPIDFSECSLDALEYSAQVAKDFRAHVVIVHALEWLSVGLNFSPAELAERNRVRDEMNARLATYVEVFQTSGVSAEGSLRAGPPVDAIIEYGQQQQCDLVIMGTHGRRGISRVLFGSTAEGVLRRATTSVLTVKSPKFAPGHRRVLTDAMRDMSTVR